jgi:putative oxidoreductase
MDLGDLLVHPYTATTARWALAGILLTAGISKLPRRAEFTQAVLAYNILSVRFARIAARCIPWLEIVAGLGLLIGLYTSVAAALACMLLSAFTIAIGINLWRGNDLDCHCFGTAHQTKIGPGALLRNLLLILITLVILRFYTGYLSVEALVLGWPQLSSPSPVGMIPLVFTGVLIGIAIILARQTFLTLMQINPSDQEEKGGVRRGPTSS